ncbi:drug/metabolite transporter (DMT)-like permease [Hasllibacter halocynthiae]|uniref:Drug/metabolite transporter (DMT)-like permease n=1 Tax=Hasllibacter halocynthiae TaxID=595589 RepID=A0A2T0X7I3_9RHOB|nr:DMT family transporter [Hasllibacter halocynthiae]PRY94911.1 drug/metabolite transporter (DMT)-like permease [Hasllibacter halocynthiae]
MDNRAGILWMLLAMAAFAAEDAAIKWTGERMPAGQVMLTLGVGGTLLFGVAAAAAGQRLWCMAPLRGALLLRNLAEGVATVCFISALTLGSLSAAVAILQATPLLITAGAALFLGERVGWRRWTAVAVGLSGVLLIIRPWEDGVRPSDLLALAATVLLTARDLATRRIPPHLGTLQVSFWAYLAILPGGALLLGATGGAQPYTADLALPIALLIALGAGGYFAVTQAMRVGEASAVAPFRYARLVFALALAALIFGERPEAATLIGAGIVIASGLYALLREGRVAVPRGVEAG